jgi:hypothetical protein
MIQQRLIIPERMPSLNALLDAKARGGRHVGAKGARWNPYNAAKKEWAVKIGLWCKQQGIRPVPGAHFRFTWIEPNRQRDPDNISAGKKLIFDGLVAAGVLPEDGWGQILSIREEFRVNRACPGVVVDILSDSLV